jgi:anti-sigma-K factor RskA
VSECPTHGALLGGYVLGSLEPAEMDEMRAHLAGCPYCGPESRRLGALPALLDTIEPADVPPPTLSPETEERVLDRFAAERRRERDARPRRSRWRPTVPRLAALAAACAAAAVLALVVLGEDEQDSPAYASATLAPLATGSNASALAWAEEVPAGTRVKLNARGLPARRMYELWCVREDGRWVSGGTFRTAANGRAEAMLTAAVRPGDYHVMVVTRHHDGEHGPALLRGRLRY